MQGTIVNYRVGKHTQTDNQMVVLVDDVKSVEEAKKLIGKIVLWHSPAKKELKGKISNVHGNSGAVRVHFETGMPGQSLGTKVQIK